MSLLGRYAPEWPSIVRALVLTAVVVPATVYLTVPRLLAFVLAMTARRGARRRDRGPDVHSAWSSSGIARQVPDTRR